jgi:antitoxin HigA-1
MSGRRPILPDPRCEPAHPGGLLHRMVLPALDRPMTEIARSLGISRRLLYSIVNQKAPVTPEVGRSRKNRP